MAIWKRNRDEVTPESFTSYMQNTSIRPEIIDENTMRFQVSNITDNVLEPDSVPVDTTYQGNGRWSTATPLFAVPAEDTVEASKLLRSTLEARGKLPGSAGIFIEDGIVAVGGDFVPRSPRDLIAEVDSTGRTAIPLIRNAYEDAVTMDLILPSE